MGLEANSRFSLNQVKYDNFVFEETHDSRTVYSLRGQGMRSPLSKAPRQCHVGSGK